MVKERLKKDIRTAVEGLVDDLVALVEDDALPMEVLQHKMPI